MKRTRENVVSKEEREQKDENEVNQEIVEELLLEASLQM